MNYFVRSGWVIVLTFAMVAIPTVLKNGWRIPLTSCSSSQAEAQSDLARPCWGR